MHPRLLTLLLNFVSILLSGAKSWTSEVQSFQVPTKFFRNAYTVKMSKSDRIGHSTVVV